MFKSRSQCLLAIFLTKFLVLPVLQWRDFLTAFALLVLLSVHCYGLIVFIRKDKKINLTLLSCSFPHVEGKKLVFLIGAKRF